MQALGSTATASHPYATAGTYSISLTVRLSGLIAGSVTRTVTVTAPDLPPTAAGTCTWNANVWTMTVQDASTDTDQSPIRTVIVDWGDGSKSFQSAGTTFSHVYAKPGNYTVTQRAIDTAGLSSATVPCPTTATPAYFTITGTVRKKDRTTALPSARATVKKGTLVVKVAYTGLDGTFQVGALTPGTYTVTVTKSGYTFAPAPQATIGAGPGGDVGNITATGP